MFRSLFFISLFLFLVGCQSAFSPREDKEIAEIKAQAIRNSALTEQQAKTIFALQGRVDALSDELNLMQGKFDEIQHDFKKYKQNSNETGDGKKEQDVYLKEELFKIHRRLEEQEVRTRVQTERKNEGQVLKKFKTESALHKSLENDLVTAKYDRLIVSASQVIEASDVTDAMRATALFYRGEAFYHEKKYDHAAIDFLDFIAKNNKDVRIQRAYLLLGDCFIYLNKKVSARYNYRNCVDKDSQSSEGKACEERLGSYFKKGSS